MPIIPRSTKSKVRVHAMAKRLPGRPGKATKFKTGDHIDHPEYLPEPILDLDPPPPLSAEPKLGLPCHRCGMAHLGKGAWCPDCREFVVHQQATMDLLPYGAESPETPRKTVVPPTWSPWDLDDLSDL